MNNVSKSAEVKKSVLYLSASEADKMKLMMIANIGDAISKLAMTGDLTPEIMKDHVKLHLDELKAIENTEIRELLSKATYAEAQVEAEKISEVFGDETYKLFMNGLREIGQF